MADTLEFNEAALPPEQRWENLGLSNDFLFGKVMQDVGGSVRQGDRTGARQGEEELGMEAGVHDDVHAGPGED